MNSFSSFINGDAAAPHAADRTASLQINEMGQRLRHRKPQMVNVAADSFPEQAGANRITVARLFTKQPPDRIQSSLMMAQQLVDSPAKPGKRISMARKRELDVVRAQLN